MNVAEKDKKMALMCLQCKACSYGRRKQRGIVFWLLKRIEGGICPFCKAYERVTGQKAHEPIPAGGLAQLGKENCSRGVSAPRTTTPSSFDLPGRQGSRKPDGEDNH